MHRSPILHASNAVPSNPMTRLQAHALSQRRRQAPRMIPLDLLVALSPTLLLAGLWLADWIRR